MEDTPFTDLVLRYALVLLRTAGLVVFCPIFGSLVLPARYRAGIALTLALVWTPLVPEPDVATSEMGSWLHMAVRESAVGLGLGVAARAVFAGIEGAAHIISGQAGFSLAAQVDPLTGNQSSVPAMFQTMATTTLVLSTNLHHHFLRAMARSYEWLPPGTQGLHLDGLYDATITLGGEVFGIAVELAAPGLVVTLAADLVLVLVGRAIPQMPTLIVGYPIKIVGGVFAMMLLLWATAAAIRPLMQVFASESASLLRALGSG